MHSLSTRGRMGAECFMKRSRRLTNITFIHAADLHLDSPFHGISQLPEEIYQRIKNSTFKSAENVLPKKAMISELSINFKLMIPIVGACGPTINCHLTHCILKRLAPFRYLPVFYSATIITLGKTVRTIKPRVNKRFHDKDGHLRHTHSIEKSRQIESIPN